MTGQKNLVNNALVNYALRKKILAITGRIIFQMH